MKALLVGTLLLALAGPALSQPLEIVQSTPVETNLAIPGIRDTRTVWLEMIRSARERLDFEVFYIRNEAGRPLEAVIEEIEAAAARGVRVRLIADRHFEKTYPDTLARLGSVKGIEVRTIPMDQLAGGVMHAKYFLVDGQELFMGSCNFDWTSLDQIKEVEVRARDPRLTSCLAQIFEADWKQCEGPRSEPTPAAVVVDAAHPVVLGADRVWPAFSPPSLTPSGLACEEEELVRLLDRAQQEILIQVMTYNPVAGLRSPEGKAWFWPSLDLAMRRAAVRGVKVKLMVADWSTGQPNIQFLKSLAQIAGMEVKIATIPPFSGGAIPYARVDHSKYVVVDQELAYVSTSNWEHGYFNQCRDLALFFQGPQANAQLRRIFDRLWSGSYAQPLQLDRDYIPPSQNS